MLIVVSCIASQWGLQLIFRMPNGDPPPPPSPFQHVENRNIIVWFKDVLTALHVNCMILFDNYRLIHGLFHIALVISSRP
jgi:hypothetical protein